MQFLPCARMNKKNENNYDFIISFYVLQTVKTLTGRQVLRRCLLSTFIVSHSPFYWMLCKSGLTSQYYLSVYLAVFGLPVVSKRCVLPRVNN